MFDDILGEKFLNLERKTGEENRVGDETPKLKPLNLERDVKKKTKASKVGISLVKIDL